MTEEEVKKYCEFMYNKKNIMNCKECPENRGEHSSVDLRLPCGQYNCWVIAHCSRN